MRVKSTLLMIVFALTMQVLQAKNDIVIVGHIVANGEHLPFVNVVIKGTAIGVATDATGHYQIVDAPLGKVTLVVSSVGYKTQEKTITTEVGQTYDVKFELVEDALNIDEIVVTGDKEEHRKRDAPVIVNVISPKLLKITQSVTLSEGLNFSTGVRMETNCQNCGFSQVRMNGMEGQYSQILINSRPIFSGLAGVYGLELIPSNMIEKIEVVRGGGSALYGSNAIAGSINLILKDPLSNSYELGLNSGIVGVGIKGSQKPASDNSINFNGSVVSDDFKRGLSIYGFHRKSGHFDVDGDGFSELTDINNSTIGTRFFNQFGHRGKITFNYFHINEERRGGNEFEKPEHEADVAEALKHKINSGSLVYDQFFRETDKLSVYLSGQTVDRNSYYGAEKDLSAYGLTNDLSYNGGLSYNGRIGTFSSFVAGLESTGGWLIDKKLGYYDKDTKKHTPTLTISDQVSNTLGVFAQYTLKYSKFTATLGGRFDNYNIKNLKESSQNQKGSAFMPRVNLLYDLLPELQLRANFSQGYRAPQIFDEDLHIDIAGAKQVRTKNADNLKKETSNSFMLSADFNKQLGSTYLGILVEGFYTQLNDAFTTSLETDDDGNGVHLRENAEGGAVIQGVNAEIKFRPFRDLSFTGGLTAQKSEYKNEQNIDDYGVTKSKKFQRTPDIYGFATIDWDFAKGFEFSLSGNYAGKMLTPYEGTNLKNATEQKIHADILAATLADGKTADDAPYMLLRETKSFLDMGAKLAYTIKLKEGGIQLFTGIKNMFQSYQTDFDTGTQRDAGYIYGPRNPRTIYFGIKIGNLL